jgi:hypothetical protein
MRGLTPLRAVMDVDQETSQTAVLASSAGQPSESALTTMKPYEPQFAPAEPNADSSSIAARWTIVIGGVLFIVMILSFIIVARH